MARGCCRGGRSRAIPTPEEGLRALKTAHCNAVTALIANIILIGALAAALAGVEWWRATAG
jgi:hypothetical protein